ncbi:MAG: helix-turn-helix domain-containing protein [Candidatus Binatia bacterium]
MPDLKGSSRLGELDYRLLARHIRDKRKRENLSLREAAEQCGISYSTLSRLERGTARPDLDTLKRILTWLDISPSSLFMGARAIRAHLRAQKNMASLVAEALADVAQRAQSHFDQSSQEHEPDASNTIKTKGPYRRLRPSLREAFAVRLRKTINYDLDAPLDPFDLEVTGVQVKRVDEIPNIPRRTMGVLMRSHPMFWSAITLPLNDAESAWLIVLNSAHTLERQRATLMEEVCHILLGHHLTMISHMEGQTFRDYNEEQERDAYGLGAAILIPKSALLGRVERGESAEEIAEHFGISQELVEYRIKLTGAWYQYKLQQHVKARSTVS